MILVFASFILGHDLVIKEFGLGLASAVFVDAFLIRMGILPATMFLLGKLNWWLPPRLNRMLPNISTKVPDDLATRQQESVHV